ncbi:mannan-binding lectin [Mycobacterium sp. EPa45]|uniref:mannan-binding lectin n=1 Tax=Mycobacterium sp. EPa45 TaxID=1545728 RepID=UPI000641E9AB|nr:mannan-binding lectin [Mycobacterium sp. EPa45]AKK26127.1 mannan-binding protein [Mycobacterium sp. EPa45]
MLARTLWGLAVASLVAAPVASASAPDFCGSLGAEWDGAYCHTSVLSERKAIRDIKVAVPGDLVDNPVTGPTIRDYLTQLVNNWRTVGLHMVADSFGEENFQILQRGDVLSVVFHEDYHADGPKPNNAFRTFTWDMSRGVRLGLADVLKPGADFGAIASLGQPFISDALDQAPPPHQPGTYPFVVDRWGPDKVYSGGYKAWALSGDELILYMPDYPVAHDTPINYTPGVMQWSMDGGTVQAHIPLSALSPVLRPQFGGT